MFFGSCVVIDKDGQSRGMRVLSWLLILLYTGSCISLKTTVFGATGGVGQLVCKVMLDQGHFVNAISRNPEAASEFENLKGASVVKADARVCDEVLRLCVSDCDSVVISLGTTAFPSKKWEKGANSPEIANILTLENILTAIETSGKTRRPSRMVLVSSIGVDRCDEMPFRLLNSYGVLDTKRVSEQIMLERCAALGIAAVVVRPGRLVGAPFTNFDLARLLKIDQGSNCGVVVDSRDVLNGDVERADVATAIATLLTAQAVKQGAVFSITNKPGPAPTSDGWKRVLAGFAGASEDALYRTESA